MSKIKNGGLDQYGTEPFERQQIGTAGVEMVNFEPVERDLRTAVSSGCVENDLFESLIHCIVK